MHTSNNKFIIFIFIILVLIIQKIKSFNTAKPTFSFNPDFQSGNVYAYNNAVTPFSGYFQTQYTVSFKKMYSTAPGAATGLGTSRATQDLGSTSYIVQVMFINQTSVTLIFATTQCVYKFSMSYIVFDFSSTLIKIGMVSDYMLYPATHSIWTSLTDQSISLKITPYMNLTTLNYQSKTLIFNQDLSYYKVLSFMNRLNQSVTSTTQPYLFNYTAYMSNTSYMKFQIYKPIGVSLNQLYFSFIFLHIQDYKTTANQSVICGQYQFTSNGGSIPIPPNSSYIFGLYLYGAPTRNNYYMNVQWSYNSSNSQLVISKSVPLSGIGNGLVRFTYNLVLIVNWKCPTGFPYINLTSFLCQDSCGNYYAQNLAIGRCIKCTNYRCIKCYSSNYNNCSICSSFAFRIINSTSSSCSCYSSFFDDGYSEKCRTCDSIVVGANTCFYSYSSNGTLQQIKFTSSNVTSWVLLNFTVFSCKTGYMLNSTKQCLLCSNFMAYCISCSNLTSCNTCNSSAFAIKYTNNLCYLCQITNCNLCSSNNICVQCSNGYQLSNNTCTQIPCKTSCNCQGYVFPIINGSCSTICGDGILAGLEQCDDGNTISRDNCSSSCKQQTCSQTCLCGGYYLPFINGTCQTVCGDGNISGFEECDDGNLQSHDGCSNICTIEICSQNCLCDGYSFPYINGSCSTICGDGFIAGNQQCDDGNIISHDGCSSSCKNQNCSQSCLCDGYSLPFANGSCKTICGDGFIAGKEQCDDSNLINFDGCSINCKIQPCNISCICGGYYLPIVNGSCTTICGDGITIGSEQCDDNNIISNDGCSFNCIFQKSITETHSNQINMFFSMFLSSSGSFYSSLIVFSLGFRIIGMETLAVFQNFQLLLNNNKNSTQKISFNIHGYSQKEYFPFNLPDQSTLFDHFNLMLFFMLTLFLLSMFFQMCGQCMNSPNKIANLDTKEGQNEQSTRKNMKKKSYRFDSQYGQGSQDVNQDFTVHYEKPSRRHPFQTSTNGSTILNQLTQDLQQQFIPQQNNTLLNRIGRVIMRQIFFDLLINCYSIFIYSTIQQFMLLKVNQIINFPTLVTLGIMIIFLITIFLYCYMTNNGFGQNQLKFKQNKYIKYWIIVVGQRILYSSFISLSISYYLYVIIGIKFIVFIYFCYNKPFYHKIQNYRNLAIQFLHLLLLVTYAINKEYLQPQKVISKLPSNLIQTIYFSILSTIIIITIIFYIRQFIQCFQSDIRKQQSQINAQIQQDKIHQRVFYSRNQIDQHTSNKDNKKIKSKKSIFTIQNDQEQFDKKSSYKSSKIKRDRLQEGQTTNNKLISQRSRYNHDQDEYHQEEDYSMNYKQKRRINKNTPRNRKNVMEDQILQDQYYPQKYQQQDNNDRYQRNRYNNNNSRQKQPVQSFYSKNSYNNSSNIRASQQSNQFSNYQSPNYKSRRLMISQKRRQRQQKQQKRQKQNQIHFQSNRDRNYNDRYQEQSNQIQNQYFNQNQKYQSDKRRYKYSQANGNRTLHQINDTNEDSHEQYHNKNNKNNKLARVKTLRDRHNNGRRNLRDSQDISNQDQNNYDAISIKYR